VTPGGREALRWGVSLGVVLAAHLGGAAALLAWRIPHDPPASVPAVMIDLEPVVSTPAPEATDAPPGPKQDESEPPAIDTETLARQLPEPEPPAPVRLPEPDRLAEAIPPPDVPPEVVIAVPPPPPPTPKPPPPPPEAMPKPAEKPVRKPEPKPKVAQTTAPAVATAPPAPAAAAPPPGVASQPSPDAVRRWQATLAAHLQRHKRYPATARRDNEEGTAYLRFTMDRSGMVLVKRLDRASGHASLDQETLALVERAQPLPAPPADMPGERFEFVVPVQFQLR
jgi:protein TonB